MKLPDKRRIQSLMRLEPLLIMLAVFFVCSCTKKVDDENFGALINEIDSYISVGRTADALASLNVVAKKAYSYSARLSVYKRYVLLGEDAKAGKTLAAGVKVLKGNPELTAVYTQYLLRHGKTKEAVKISSVLQGTSYGSLNAEAMLRSSVDSASYHDSRYIQTYIDSFTRTKNSYWLRNAASLYMGSGEKDKAASLYPGSIQSRADAIFWACVFYDRRDYGSALNVLDEAKKISAYEKKSAEIDAAITALESDSYILFGDEKKSYDIRCAFLSAYSLSLSEDDSSYSLLPSLLVNNAYWDKKHGDYISRYTTLNKLISQFPTFVPGLIAYSNYALDTSAMSENDPLTVAVRKTGLKSLDMIEYDKITKIPIEDALYQMRDLRSPELVAIRQRLLDAGRTKRTLNEKIANVYEVLEGTERSRNLYPPLLAEYAVERLLELGQYEEAKTLFDNYIKARYEDEKIFETPEKLDYWEGECQAYFDCVEGDIDEAQTLFEYLVYHGQRKSVNFVSSANANDYAVEPMVNLAVIYEVQGRVQNALKLYRDASISTDDNFVKAEILYRIAGIHRSQGDVENALSVLRFCLDLNGGHEKARQMYRTLSH